MAVRLDFQRLDYRTVKCTQWTDKLAWARRVQRDPTTQWLVKVFSMPMFAECDSMYGVKRR